MFRVRRNLEDLRFMDIIIMDLMLLFQLSEVAVFLMSEVVVLPLGGIWKTKDLPINCFQKEAVLIFCYFLLFSRCTGECYMTVLATA